MALPAESASVVPLWRERARRKIDPELAAQLDRVHALPWGSKLFRFYETADGFSDDARAYLGLIDRYYLLVSMLQRVDFLQQGAKGNRWLYERVREVEAEPDGCLDLWSRFHFKTSIITQAGSIQELLRDPEITICIFSHTKSIARGFLWHIKQTLEQNETLKRLYPEVIYQDPAKESPRWSVDAGIVVKRHTNPPESTIEGWGLIDGMPTGKHFKLRIYDDTWTDKNVTTPEQIQKTIKARELSDNLGVRGGREWNIGTRYSHADGYGSMIDSGLLKPRIYPATHNGELDGEPVMLTAEEWEARKRWQPSQVAAQLLQNPLAGHERMFHPDWFKAYWIRPRTLNVYILCDPSKGSPSKRSDRAAIAVIGVDANENKYLLDGFRHRMDLPSRWEALRAMHKKWSQASGVQCVEVGYEQYGMLTDIEYFELRMRQENYVFIITEVSWTRDHTRSKEDRVERLVPDVKEGSFFLPAAVWSENRQSRWSVSDGRVVCRKLEGKPDAWREMENSHEAYRIIKPIKRVDEEKNIYDLSLAMMEEMAYFPLGTHDDLVDAASRIYDLQPTPPQLFDAADYEPELYVDT